MFEITAMTLTALVIERLNSGPCSQMNHSVTLLRRPPNPFAVAALVRCSAIASWQRQSDDTLLDAGHLFG
ncbi:MAG: hypothetical protein L0219_04795 [Phycisphaerales bacterium]|nr:hypothetical protein [Phycisphaerales bacterium]